MEYSSVVLSWKEHQPKLPENLQPKMRAREILQPKIQHQIQLRRTLKLLLWQTRKTTPNVPKSPLLICAKLKRIPLLIWHAPFQTMTECMSHHLELSTHKHLLKIQHILTPDQLYYHSIIEAPNSAANDEA